jgi:hypothetical protein
MADFLNNIVSAWNDEEGDKDSELYPDETNSPNINILIRAARKFLDQKISEEEFVHEVESTEDRLDKALNELQVYSSRLEAGSPRKDLAEQSELAYEEFGQGLEEMAKLDRESVENGIDLCVDAAFKLESLNQHYLELEIQASMIDCVMCSHPNPPGRADCEKCGATLPTTMKAASAENAGYSNDLVMVPKEYLDLYDACDKVAANEIPLEVWQEQIDLFNERFNSASQQIHDITNANREAFEAAPQILAEAEGVVDALDEALEALQMMQMFAEDGNVEHLNQGWMNLLAGTQKVQQRGLAFYQNLEMAQEG